MTRYSIFTSLTLLATALASTAYADPIFFSLDAPVQAGNPGETINFTADVFSDDFAFLNGDTYFFAGPGPVDDSGVFLNFPQFFGPGDEFDDVVFSYTLPLDIPTGTYLGSFSLYGGFTSDDNTLQGSQNFSVSVVNDAASTPEPSSMALFGAGFVVLAGYKRRGDCGSF